MCAQVCGNSRSGVKNFFRACSFLRNVLVTCYYSYLGTRLLLDVCSQSFLMHFLIPLSVFLFSYLPSAHCVTGIVLGGHWSELRHINRSSHSSGGAWKQGNCWTKSSQLLIGIMKAMKWVLWRSNNYVLGPGDTQCTFVMDCVSHKGSLMVGPEGLGTSHCEKPGADSQSMNIEDSQY